MEFKVLGRRNNPDYSQVTGLVTKELAKDLRVYCVNQEKTISDVIEEALKEYLEKRGASK